MKELENLIENTFKSKSPSKPKGKFDLIELVESILRDFEGQKNLEKTEK